MPRVAYMKYGVIYHTEEHFVETVSTIHTRHSTGLIVSCLHTDCFIIDQSEITRLSSSHLAMSQLLYVLLEGSCAVR